MSIDTRGKNQTWVTDNNWIFEIFSLNRKCGQPTSKEDVLMSYTAPKMYLLYYLIITITATYMIK